MRGDAVRVFGFAAIALIAWTTAALSAERGPDPFSPGPRATAEAKAGDARKAEQKTEEPAKAPTPPSSTAKPERTPRERLIEESVPGGCLDGKVFFIHEKTGARFLVSPKDAAVNAAAQVLSCQRHVGP